MGAPVNSSSGSKFASMAYRTQRTLYLYVSVYCKGCNSEQLNGKCDGWHMGEGSPVPCMEHYPLPPTSSCHHTLMCSLTQKFSAPSCLGFLWGFHHLGMVHSIIGLSPPWRSGEFNPLITWLVPWQAQSSKSHLISINSVMMVERDCYK
jgi:hypothetical protein